MKKPLKITYLEYIIEHLLQVGYTKKDIIQFLKSKK